MNTNEREPDYGCGHEDPRSCPRCDDRLATSKLPPITPRHELRHEPEESLRNEVESLRVQLREARERIETLRETADRATVRAGEAQDEAQAKEERYLDRINELIQETLAMKAELTALRDENERLAQRNVIELAINLTSDVENENDLNDGGFFEAGFIAAKTKILDVLIAERDATTTTTETKQ